MIVKIFFHKHSRELGKEINEWMDANKIGPKEILARIYKFRQDPETGKSAFSMYYEIDRPSNSLVD
ncbi:MAG: hypothetical protein AB1529_00890 [Candidatus Micrarchaeota archaeon]